MSIQEINTGREILRTIKYNPQTGLKMEKIALKLGRSNRVVFAQMVDYFYRSKKDPLDINDELLKNTLLKQHKEYIGFIKTQESELLIPIKREVARMISNQRNIVDFFNGQDRHNKAVMTIQQSVLSAQQLFSGQQSEIQKVLTVISGKLSAKERLKNQFHHILNSYVKSRDAFGMMTSGKEKEELIQITRNQIDLL
ncbi:BfmA/BtgA family mobilization protein [Pedobacter sp. NJ-S-72]